MKFDPVVFRPDREVALQLWQLLAITLYITAVLHYLAVGELVYLDVKPGNTKTGIIYLSIV